MSEPLTPPIVGAREPIRRGAQLATGAFALALVLQGCVADTTATTEPLLSTSTASASTTSVPPPRLIKTRIDIEASGLGEPLHFEVPPATRSIFVNAIGADGDVIALASLRIADGAELFGWAEARDATATLESLRDAHVRSLPGPTFLEAGVTNFAWLHPFEPVAGQATLQIASTGDAVDITVLLHPADSGNRLALDVFTVNEVDTPLIPALVPLRTVSDMFAAIGIDVVWGTVGTIELPNIDIDISALDAPDGALARLVAAAAPSGTDALDVFIVADLGIGTSGVAPSIPGPLLPSAIGGVIVVDHFRPQDTGVAIVHEVAHYLGLPHVQFNKDDGTVVDDPFADTEPNTGNLMDGGRVISDQQAAAIRSSPLVE